MTISRRNNTTRARVTSVAIGPLSSVGYDGTDDSPTDHSRLVLRFADDLGRTWSVSLWPQEWRRICDRILESSSLRAAFPLNPEPRTLNT